MVKIPSADISVSSFIEMVA